MTDTTELVARLTRERDEARLRFNDIDLCKMAQAPCNALLDAETRIAELTRERDEARAAALEEAAKVADAIAQSEQESLFKEMRRRKASRSQTLIDQMCYATSAVEDVSISIRALKEPS
jgi:hypothetical protein